jgi:organic radical activating enzyme
LEVSEKYQHQVLSHIQNIRFSGRPAIIFGAGRAGWYIMKVLEHYNVPITAFCDNSEEKQGTRFGYLVLSPVDIAARFPDALVFIGVFIPNTAALLQNRFHELGLRDVYFHTAAFLFEFIVKVAGRKCDSNVLAKSIEILFENYQEGAIHYGLTKGSYFVSPFVTSVITQKCSLRCRDCAQLIPYYEKPVNFSVESIVDDLKRYAKAFDVVPEISLHGGEPFLYPDLQRLCREVATIPNIVFISFITNGTILPPDETLRQLSTCGADVHQSGGYGALSRHQDALIEAFRRHSIYSDILYCSTTEMWTQSPPYIQHSRSAVDNDEIYRRCVSSNVCCQIMNGELHRCALSMHGMHQGLFPKDGSDFVLLRQEDDNANLVEEHVRNFISRNTALTVCDYCSQDGGTLVAPAIQLPAA